MISIRPLVVVFALLGSAALAQDAPNPYDGNWSGVCRVSFDLEVHGTGGKWIPHADRGITKNDPCAAMPKPIVVEKATADILVFTIKGSEVLRGCSDPKVAFHPVDATHMEVTRAPGSTQTFECKMSRS